MPRLARGDEKPPMSAEARRWWPAPSEVRLTGGRSEDEPSGVLFLLADIWLADMVCGCGRECVCRVAREPTAGILGRSARRRATAGLGGHGQAGGGARLAHGRALLLQHQLASKQLEGDGRRRAATGQRRGTAGDRRGSKGGSRSLEGRCWSRDAKEEPRRNEGKQAEAATVGRDGARAG